METTITTLQSSGEPARCQAANSNTSTCESNATWRLNGPGFTFDLCGACVKRVSRELEDGAVLAVLLAQNPPRGRSAGGRESLTASAREHRRADPQRRGKRRRPAKSKG